MFSSADLRFWNNANDSALLLPGVTHAHHLPWPDTLRRDRVPPSTPPKYFLTFQGLWNVGKGGTSFVRLNMAAMLNSTKKLPKAMKSSAGEPLPLPSVSYEPPSDVFISIAGEQWHFKEKRHYYSLFDSAYSLVMHGHGRWSYRLMECLSGGAIPVIMAEGWCLPYQELIDWEQISVQRPEAMGMDPRALVEGLTRDPERIHATRKRVAEVYEKYLGTYQSRITAMLRSAVVWKQTWQERERSTLRMLADVFAKEHPDQVLKYLSADRADEARTTNDTSVR